MQIKKQFLQRVKERVLVQTPCFFQFLKTNQPTLPICESLNCMLPCGPTWPRDRCQARCWRAIERSHRGVATLLRRIATMPWATAYLEEKIARSGHGHGAQWWGVICCDDVDLKIRGSYVFLDDVSWWFLQILTALIQLQCWRMICVSTRIIQILRDCSWSPQESCFPSRYLQLS